MAKLNLTLAVEGLDIALKLTDPKGDLLAGPWRRGMERLGTQVGLGAQRAAPQRTGKLVGSVRVAVQKRPFPTWVAIRIRARSKKGYPYPLLLEFSGKHHHKDWLLNAVQPIASQSDGTLEQIAANIAAAWERG